MKGPSNCSFQMLKWEGVCCSKHVHVYALESKTVLDKCDTCSIKWEVVCCSKHGHLCALESKTILDKCDVCSKLCFLGYPHKDREYRPPTKFLTCRSCQHLLKKHPTFQHSTAVSWVYYVHHLPEIGSPPCLTHSLPCMHERHMPG